MRIISYGDPNIIYGKSLDEAMLMDGRRRCNDCDEDCDEDDCFYDRPEDEEGVRCWMGVGDYDDPSTECYEYDW